MSRSRSYVFTINNYSQEDISAVHQLKYQYLVYGKEVAPTTGTPHLQGFVYFKNTRTLSAVSKDLRRASLQAAKGTAQQNREYCTKDGDFFEDGKIPSQGTRSDLEGVREFVKNNPKAPMRRLLQDTNVNYQAVRLAEKYLTYCETRRDWPMEIIWIWGPSGVGKTRYAFEKHPDAYFKTGPMKWWPGYDAHEVVIVDDFRESDCDWTYLLHLTDTKPFTIEYKGGERQMLAKTIYFTSPYPPEEAFTTHEDKYQILRRITKVIGLS